MTDISSLSTSATAENTHTVIFRHPIDGTDLEHEGEPMYAEIVGKDSKEFKTAISRLINADKARKGEKDFDYDSEQARGARLLAACTTKLVYYAKEKWHKYIIADADNETDKSKLHTAIKDSYLEFAWMKEDVDKDMDDRANFLQEGSTSSPSM